MECSRWIDHAKSRAARVVAGAFPNRYGTWLAKKKKEVLSEPPANPKLRTKPIAAGIDIDAELTCEQFCTVAYRTWGENNKDQKAKASHVTAHRMALLRWRSDRMALLLGATALSGVLIYYFETNRRRRNPSLLILDGGTGLELKKRKAQGLPVAYDLTLFSTAALRSTPEGIVEMHRDYIKAGCTVLTTASYAVTNFYLDKIGEGSRVKELAQRSVELAKAARAAEGAESSVLIAASVPPLGESYQAAALPPAELRAQYQVLLSGLGGCDVYLCETMGTVAEGVLAVQMTMAAYPGERVWLSFTPRRADASEGGGVRLSADGSTISAAVDWAAALGVDAILFNCATPELVKLAISEAASCAAGRMRIGGYANFWEEHDPRGWSIDKNESGDRKGDQKAGGMVVRTDLSSDEYACRACDFIECGATIVGGCCGIGPDTMNAVCRRAQARKWRLS